MAPKNTVAKLLAARRRSVQQCSTKERAADCTQGQKRHFGDLNAPSKDPHSSFEGDIVEEKVGKRRKASAAPQDRKTWPALFQALSSALADIGAEPSWVNVLDGRLQRQTHRDVFPDKLRQWLRQLRTVKKASELSPVAKTLMETLIQKAPESETCANEAALRILSMLDSINSQQGAAAVGQSPLPVSPSGAVKTLSERFQHVSSDLACPHGCFGPVRYGHRVGDLSKYATMERSEQLTSVRCYCPHCYDEFDAVL